MVLFQNKLSFNTPKMAGNFSSGKWDGGGSGRGAPHLSDQSQCCSWGMSKAVRTPRDLSRQLLCYIVANRNTERHHASLLKRGPSPTF